MRGLLLLLLVAAALAGAAPARAGVVWSVAGPPQFRSLPGEANAVSVLGEGGGTGVATVVRDDGAPLRANACTPLDVRTVRCAGVFSMTVRLGDERDSLRAAGVPVAGDGGPGDDVLSGSELNDALGGGPGHDRVDAAAGDDQVVQGLAATRSRAAPAPTR